MRILGIGGGQADKESFSDYWRRTAEKRGGEIGLYTFATFLGGSSGGILELPGLMYTVGDSVWFEDFEKDNWLFRMIGGKKKYEKTEMSFLKIDVAFTRLVSRGTAFTCIRGSIAPGSTPPLGALGRVFTTSAVQIGFTKGHSFFFEIFKREEVLAFLR